MIGDTSEDLALSKLAEVMDKTKLSGSSIYRKIAGGSFPPPIKVGDAAVAWLTREIDNWLEERIRNRAADHERASKEQQERAKRGKARGRKAKLEESRKQDE